MTAPTDDARRLALRCETFGQKYASVNPRLMSDTLLFAAHTLRTQAGEIERLRALAEEHADTMEAHAEKEARGED
ncbi:MAG TPA: hypothetical protein VKA63_05400 [Candidatus Krumholzibacteria bacterium]|nr:hypothetical protein [Candidatus Krumholzibacteria bacterium]